MAEITAVDLKRFGGELAQAHLMNGANLSEGAAALAKTHSLNPEQVRRVCETANQNVYLALFRNKDARGNIVFDTAKSEDIIKNLQEQTMNELDYKTAPEDFRKQASLGQALEPTALEKTASAAAVDGAGLVKEAAHARKTMEKLSHFHSAVKAMKFSEETALEHSFNKLAELAVTACSNGDSLADFSKLAMRHTMASGHDVNKMVTVLSKVAAHVESRGIKPSTELTKVSEMTIDPSHSIFAAVDGINQALIKLGGFHEMDYTIDLFKTATATKTEKPKFLDNAVRK